jgi:hypothetical protein
VASLRYLRTESAGKPIAAQVTRRLVSTGLQSLFVYPKPDDLSLGRMKRTERCVEVRKGCDVQFHQMTWGLGQKTNLVWRLLVLPEVTRRLAVGEGGDGVEH